MEFSLGGISRRRLGVRTSRLARHFVHKSVSEDARKDKLKLSVTGDLAAVRNNAFSLCLSKSLFQMSVAFPEIGTGKGTNKAARRSGRGAADNMS